MTEIGEYCFYGCSSLENVILPENLNLILDFAFLECSSLKEIIIPNKVTQIWGEAFKDCTNIKTLVIGNSVNYIGLQAFLNCGLENTVFNVTEGWKVWWNANDIKEDISSEIMSDSELISKYISTKGYYAGLILLKEG